MAKNRRNDIDSFSGIFIGSTNTENSDNESITEEPANKNNSLDELPVEKKENGEAERISTKKKHEKIGRGRPKERRETKERKSIAFFPSKYRQLEKIAYVKRTTATEILNALLDEYVSENSNYLQEYDKIVNKKE